MNDIEIRNATLDDLETLAKLDSEVSKHPWSLVNYQDVEQNPALKIYTLIKDSSIIGGAAIENQVDTLEIHQIWIKRSETNQGYGKYLLSFIIKQLALDKTTIYLQVAKSNLIAQKLYRGYGFTVVGVRNNYYTHDNDDAITMLLELNQ